MVQGSEVLSMLRPDGGWVIFGNDFYSIRWDEGVEPLTKAEFDAAFAEVDAWKTQKQTEKEIKRAAVLAKLEALGLDADDLKALGL